MRKTLALALALVLAAVAAGCASTGTAPLSAPATLTVTGTLSTPRGYMVDTSKGCLTADGFADIRTGTQVVITDESGKTVALGRLDSGVVKDDVWPNFRCVFPFTVSGVPAGRPFYGVEVSNRGRVQYTPERLDAPLALTLGY